MVQRCRLLKQCWNLPPRHCGGRGACCLCVVGTFLQGTVGHGCRLLWGVLNPNSGKLWGRGICCLSSVRTFLLGTVRQGCRLFKRCRNLPPEHCKVEVHAA